MSTYINRAGDGYRETVDEFDTRAEARAMLGEYAMSDPAGRYYVSSRPCRDWTDADAAERATYEAEEASA